MEKHPSRNLPDTHDCAVIIGSHRFAFTARHIDFREPVGSPAGGTGHSHNPARCGSDFNSLHEVLVDDAAQ